ncbi:MAG: dihydroorotate dehydrogenase-like protein [Bacteroidales bacterium]|nr:dihydroorotate dehydrogenase-like protein [Bacteroidales bacterium]
MVDLSVKYMGFKLRSPLILGSCALTKDIDKLKQAEEAGFGAVVLKSIFEEEIRNEVNAVVEDDTALMYRQAYDYMVQYQEMASSSKYLDLIKDATEKLSIPVIASVNCASPSGWTKYAKMIQDAGAKALEINYFILPANFENSADYYYDSYMELVENLKNTITIPFALKVSTYFTDMAYFLQKLSYTGISSLVIFNRFHAPDINIDKLEFSSTNSLGNEFELSNTLRWTGLLSGHLRCDLSATTGVHDSKGLIKLLLAGANSVQAASVFYQKGIGYGSTMLIEMKDWMEKHGYNSVDDFRGLMSYKKVANPDSYFRIQFMKHMAGIE